MPGTPAEFALRHFEKLILGGLCAVLLLAWSFAPPEVDVVGVDREVRLVGAHMKSVKPAPEVDVAGDPVAELRERMEEVPEAQAFPAWSAHRRPFVLAIGKPWTEREGELGQVTLEAELLPRSVRLSWKEPKQSEFLLLSYRLERKLAGGEWTTLLEPSAGTLSFEDAGLEPRVSASYRLRVSAELDQISVERSRARRERLLLPASEAERTSAVTAPLTLRQNVFVIPSTIWLPNDLERKPGRAYLRVWIRTEAGFRKKGFPVEVGEEIGKIVSVGLEEVDYRTSARLLEVREEVREAASGRKIRTGVVKIEWAGGQVEEITTQAAPPK